jgi:hypothetical protein
MLVALADARGKNGRVDEGLDLVTEGPAKRTGLRLAEAELRRIKGELLMIKDFSKVAEPEILFEGRSQEGRAAISKRTASDW